MTHDNARETWTVKRLTPADLDEMADQAMQPKAKRGGVRVDVIRLLTDWRYAAPLKVCVLMLMLCSGMAAGHALNVSNAANDDFASIDLEG